MKRRAGRGSHRCFGRTRNGFQWLERVREKEKRGGARTGAEEERGRGVIKTVRARRGGRTAAQLRDRGFPLVTDQTTESSSRGLYGGEG